MQRQLCWLGILWVFVFIALFLVGCDYLRKQDDTRRLEQERYLVRLQSDIESLKGETSVDAAVSPASDFTWQHSETDFLSAKGRYDVILSQLRQLDVDFHKLRQNTVRRDREFYKCLAIYHQARADLLGLLAVESQNVLWDTAGDVPLQE